MFFVEPLALGGGGAARSGVLLEVPPAFGGAGRGGGALLFFGGNAGVGLSVRNGSLALSGKALKPNGSPLYGFVWYELNMKILSSRQLQLTLSLLLLLLTLFMPKGSKGSLVLPAELKAASSINKINEEHEIIKSQYYL